MARAGRPSVARRLVPVLSVATVGVLTAAVVDRWSRRWRATDDERRMELPGDELLPGPDGQTTRATTIDAPPEAVWPWLVQIGADRGGFYSYDALENLVGLGIHSADAIAPDWQERAVGDLVLANRAGTGGWSVGALVPERALVLQLADMRTGRPVSLDEGATWEFLWSFVLEPLPADRTRLLVRERVRFGPPAMRLAMAPVGLVSLVMTARMLRGIADRSECRWHAHHGATIRVPHPDPTYSS